MRRTQRSSPSPPISGLAIIFICLFLLQKSDLVSSFRSSAQRSVFSRRTATSPFVLLAQTRESDAPDDDSELTWEAFKEARHRISGRNSEEEEVEQVDDLFEKQSIVEADYDGYAFRDALVEKWGVAYDVDFNRVDSFGFRKLYLNVLPYHLGRRPFRHETELDYLCHLQAVVEILQEYEQLDNILYQIQECTKRPKSGNPIVAIPLRLDLTREQVEAILGY